MDWTDTKVERAFHIKEQYEAFVSFAVGKTYIGFIADSQKEMSKVKVEKKTACRR